MGNPSDHTGQEPFDLALTLARAAAAFRDADFFESAILFWSAALKGEALTEEEEEKEEAETLQESILDFDLEQELGLDVQIDEPIELVFPQPSLSNQRTISLAQRHCLIALCYLARHINVRIDVLPTGNDTLTTLGSPQRVYGSFTQEQKQRYHALLAIVFSSSSKASSADFTPSSSNPSTKALEANERLLLQQTTLRGNESTVTWQTTLPQKRTPHNLPRNFSFLNPSACTVAGCSIPRNDLDIDALEQVGFRLVISMIKESPLSQSWFQRQQQQQQHRGSAPKTSTTSSTLIHPKKIRNAFVPIENRKAPLFPEVFEVLMGWCVRAGEPLDETEEGKVSKPFDHERATLVHCGGGKGRAGIVLAAHLIRFGPLGNQQHGYCVDCLLDGNVHAMDLDQFRRGLGDQTSTAATLPDFCRSRSRDQEEEDEEDEEESEEEGNEYTGLIRRVRNSQCLNRFKPMMTAKEAMAHLRTLRPGSIETVEQEKAVRAYGDWLWKRSMVKSTRRAAKSTLAKEESSLTQTVHNVGSTREGQESLENLSSKDKKDKKKDTVSKPRVAKAMTPTPPVEPVPEDLSEEDQDRARRSGGKKGKKGSKQTAIEECKPFVPPPAHKIIKLPGSGKGSHHQHHLIVQHNLRARQLQRGEKSKKKKGGGGGGNKNSKDRPSFQITGTALSSPPRLIVLTGLPGSGKTHVVSTLLRDFPEHFVSISQDELGSRSVCERLLAQNMRHQQQALAARGPLRALPMTVFVDRCNPTRAERRGWYEDAFQPDETAMVWFTLNSEACVERVDARVDHPTVAPGRGQTVVNSFVKSFEAPHLGKESWCKTLIEVGDDEGSDRLIELLSEMARGVGTPMSERKILDQQAQPAKIRPAFIPASVLQRKRVGGGTGAEGSGPRSPTKGSMDSVIEEDSEKEEEEEEEYPSGGKEEDEEENDEEEKEEDEEADEKDEDNKDDNEEEDRSRPGKERLISNAITGALRFATPIGHRPAVKKPVRGSWKQPGSGSSDTRENSSAAPLSPKGVSFATNMVSYDRPLQKYPRTPHLFDPLTIRQSRPLIDSRAKETVDQAQDRHLEGEEEEEEKEEEDASSTPRQSAAISRNDLLLPDSALDQILTPKAHQVLTVEEKLDGANIGFSVLHFRGMNGFGGQGGPPPRLRVQNRNHFVHPDDHWQFKKLGQWMETHREDLLWLCEGQWRFEKDRQEEDQKEQKEEEEEEDQNKEEKSPAEDKDENQEPKEETKDNDTFDDTDDEEEEEDEEEEYMDETMVLQDGMAPYVLYGEWMYAKHSVEYTGLQSWFVPFDLFDVKTGTFVSRAVFRNAIARTRLVTNPSLEIPVEVKGDVDRMVEWVLAQLQSRSKCMREDDQEEDEEKKRVEGLYFRVDQGDRLLHRAKVVRSDFIAGEERWGMKEQRANQLRHDAHYAGMYDDEDEEDEEE